MDRHKRLSRVPVFDEKNGETPVEATRSEEGVRWVIVTGAVGTGTNGGGGGRGGDSPRPEGASVSPVQPALQNDSRAQCGETF